MALQRVETDAIQDDAVTTAKIAANAVAAADIAADAITNVKVAAGAAIAVAKISGLGTAATLTAGTAANNVVQLDGSGRLPAVSGANLTGVSTDTSAMENNIAILAFKTQSSNNLAKFNLIDQVIDEYKDDTGLGTQTTCDRVGSTATDGYMATVYAGAQTQIAQGTGTAIGNCTSRGGLAGAFDGDTTQSHTASACTTNLPAGYLGKDWGSGVTKTITGIKVWPSDGSGAATIGWSTNYTGAVSMILEGSTDNFSSSIVNLGTIFSAVVADTHTQVDKLSGLVTSTAYRYHRVKITRDSTNDAEFCISELEFYVTPSTTNATGTLISTANTALSAPTTGDICMLIENASGTATLNTAGNDLRCAITRNGGTGWDYVTLVDKGSWGTNKKILVGNNVAFSNSASGTDMRYKIEWANQASGTKVVNIHATSLAWA